MNQKELRELIEFLKEQDIYEFELERGDFKVRIKRAGEHAPPAEMRFVHLPPAAVPHPAAAEHAAPPATAATPPSGAASAAAARAEEEGLHQVRSPIVGTYYEAPSPGAPPFVKVGETVTAGQVLCIIEAMKLMNEIEADVAGEIVKKFVSNGQPVEYGQPLFAVRSAK
ncbi:MAG: acetyl-CoA carboxylase biotin carboxyl carrier protein [Acidobacteria bacterium]|nr:acetyl-CoA carboxylase biotin carboxyl carrier protein [Acidobacteriota bacterium]